MSSNRWTSWHLHLATGAVSALDRVVTEVVAPTADTIGHPWFFIRYWQGGPHIRLRVADLDPTELTRLRSHLEDGMLAHGRPCDGEPIIDANAYAQEAARHARGETGENRQVTTLRSPGVHDATYHPETDRYGGPHVMPASERMFVRSSALVANLLPQLESIRARRHTAIRLTEAAARCLGNEPDRAVFFEIGRRSWSAWARSYGYDEGFVDRVAHVASAPTATAFVGNPWIRQWHTDVSDLCRSLTTSGVEVPGAVLSSQVHMTHNRLGLTILDELHTYAVLARAFPAPAEAVPDLGMPLPS